MNATEITLPTNGILGGTFKFSLIIINGEYFVENHQDLAENLPRLPLSKQLVDLYINQLESYLDLDPANSEEARLYNEELFNSMCEQYFKEGY